MFLSLVSKFRFCLMFRIQMKQAGSSLKFTIAPEATFNFIWLKRSECAIGERIVDDEIERKTLSYFRLKLSLPLT